jgi:hypothetical protein
MKSIDLINDNSVFTLKHNRIQGVFTQLYRIIGVKGKDVNIDYDILELKKTSPSKKNYLSKL